MGTWEATRQQVMYTVFGYFLQVQLDSELVCIQAENLIAGQKLLEQIEAFAQAGRKALSDVLTQKAATAKAELDLVNARLNYEVAKLNLLKLIGDDSLNTSALTISGLPLDSSDVQLRLSSDTALSATLLKRKDVAAQQQTINAAYNALATAKSGYWPTVSLSTGISTGYSANSVWSSPSTTGCIINCVAGNCAGNTRPTSTTLAVNIACAAWSTSTATSSRTKWWVTTSTGSSSGPSLPWNTRATDKILEINVNRALHSTTSARSARCSVGIATTCSTAIGQHAQE